MTKKSQKRINTCGCCAGGEAQTPLPAANRPGLDQLVYRVGTHAAFLETMKAHLSSGDYPALAGLTSREATDPAIAWLDAWAILADVLSFYQERIANEGYLRTATERRSLLELARLVGYKLRPGVAASVYLAFSLEKGYAVEIPKGTGAQSVPSPGELPQPFETAEPLPARAEWNELKPRLTRPQIITSTNITNLNTPLYFQGTNPALKPNLPLLFIFTSSSVPTVYRWIAAVEAQREANRTKVTLQSPPNPDFISAGNVGGFDWIEEIPLLTMRSSNIVDIHSDLIRKFSGHFGGSSYDYFKKISKILPVGETPPSVELKLLNIKAAPFGHNAPLKAILPGSEGGSVIYEEWPLVQTAPNSTVIPLVTDTMVPLDGEYDQIIPESYVLIVRAGQNPIVRQVKNVQPVYIAAYGLARQVTQITLYEVTEANKKWLQDGDNLSALRQTMLYFADPGKSLEPAEAPIDPIKEPIKDNRIELAGFYPDLEPGHLLLVSGEALEESEEDSHVTYEPTGLTQAELVRLNDVEHAPASPELRSTLILANNLAYIYKRDTVTIYGNVVRATHGQTRREVLGSGDGNQAWPAFKLQQKPLTYLAAPTPAGAASSLEVRVNDVLWHEVEHLFEQEPTGRVYLTRADDEEQLTVNFGDGEHGARLPTGVENIKAVYRTGLGKVGNVKAEQVRLLTSKPLGVKSVINPQAASGGADREGSDQARRNVPLGVMALDRLVSVQDYADFARGYAGIGKASATRLSDGRRYLLHLTIAGADDIPIDRASDLYLNLVKALRQYGDPYLPIQVDQRVLKLLIIQARVRLWPDYLWESVEPKIRAALLETLGFERRDLGQDVLSSEVVSAIQAVPGVAYVDLEVLDAVDENGLEKFLEDNQNSQAGSSLTLTLALKPRIATQLAKSVSKNVIQPAQLVYLSPISGTLVLEEIIE